MNREMIFALTAGALFGIGLAISGMADPLRVRGFLDVFGSWDPTLVFVLIGAIIPMSIAWFARQSLNKPFAASEFVLPGTTHIDVKLLMGAALFGIGWGVSGLCPGPALVGLALVPESATIFVVSMILGMMVHRLHR